MYLIEPRTISAGKIPFNLYSLREDNNSILFCRSGFNISDFHLDSLDKHNTRFYVTNDELDKYLDYSFEQIQEISSNVEIDLKDKARLMRHIGKRVVSQLFENPKSGQSIGRAKVLSKSYSDAIMNSEDIATLMINVAAVGQYNLVRSLNTCTFCIMLGKYIYPNDISNLPELGLAGLLRDIGNIEVKTSTLEKPGVLNAEEKKQVQLHARYSFEILSKHELPESVIQTGKSHHEYLDGSGYPEGVSGDMIHEFTKIVTVADIYDAITTRKIYKIEKSPIEALREMGKMATQIDQNSFNALLKIVIQNEKLIAGFKQKLQSEDHISKASDDSIAE